MLTLGQASEDFKKFLKVGGMILAVIVALFIVVRIIIIVKSIILPPQPPKPTMQFGKLFQISFPHSITNQRFVFNVNTLSGYLPQSPAATNVYRMQTNKPDLLAANRMQNAATSIGYPAKYNVISSTVLEWKLDSNGLTKTLQGNTVNGNFTIASSYLTDKNVLSGKNAPTPSKALDMASRMFANMNLALDDLDQSKTKTNPYLIRNGALFPATSQSATQIIEADYYQSDINKLPIYYEKPNSSNINVVVAGGESGSQIVSASYIHQLPTNEYASYPLKTTDKAYEDLKQGNAYIASYEGSSNTISINNVFLAYYIGGKSQDFMLPIFVFTGNDNFYAYVSAVTDEWISK